MNGQWLGNKPIRTNWATRKPAVPTQREGVVIYIYLSMVFIWHHFTVTTQRRSQPRPGLFCAWLDLRGFSWLMPWSFTAKLLETPSASGTAIPLFAEQISF